MKTATLNREQIDALKSQAGITPYQNRLKQFTESGSDFRALCPWHEREGSSPSLAVFPGDDNPEHYFFRCMSKCDKHGDVISFVQLVDKVSFLDATKKIASEIGQSLDQPAVVSEKLTPSDATAARQYLTGQGVSEEVAKLHKVSCVVHPKLGLTLAFPYDADPNVVKYRAVNPKDKNSKFSHRSGHPSEHLLFNVRHVDEALQGSFGANVFVTESERDCLMLESHGYLAVSVSSATTCVDRDGSLKIELEQLETLAKADNIILALDQDPAGQSCAEAFENCPVFRPNQVKRMVWEYGGKRSKQSKDIGEIYSANPLEFRSKIDALADEALQRPPLWRQNFRTISELDTSPIVSLIDGFLPEGNIGIGGLSGHGKTFVALSIAKALTTGKSFVGKFHVPEIRPVLYLVPEVNSRQFNARAKYFNIPDDENLFLTRTLSEGKTLPLNHPSVVAAVKNLHHPVVILDTGIRFSTAEDENSAVETRWLEDATRGLREAGALAVIILHHSPKSSVNELPNLENTFRGSSDFGAQLDVGYCIRRDDNAPGLQVQVIPVKERDIIPPKAFNLGLKYTDSETGQEISFIQQNGDLAFIAKNLDTPEPVTDEEKFILQVHNNPKLTFEELGQRLKRSKSHVAKIANKLGWQKKAGGIWTETVSEDWLEPETVS